ncbi:hypothetical protein FQZ97_783740 [compost metagenome]
MPRLHGLERVLVERLEILPADIAQVGSQDHVVEVPHGIRGRQGFFGIDVQPRSRDTELHQRVHQRLLVHQSGARGIDQIGGRLHCGQRGGVDHVAAAFGKNQVQADDVGRSEELVLVHPLHAGGLGALVGQVGAPGHHIHAEGQAHFRHRRAQLAQAEHAQALACQGLRHGRLPHAAAHGGIFGRQVLEEAQDVRPGQFRRRGVGVGAAGRAADDDALLGAGLQVDGVVAHAGRDQQAQLGQRADALRGERRALAHGHDHVETVERGLDLFGRDEIIEDLHLGVTAQRGPIRIAPGYVVVIVEYCDFQVLSPGGVAPMAPASRPARMAPVSSSGL